MKTTRLKLALLLTIVTMQTAFSDADKVGNINIGAAAGYSTGLGLSYRQWLGTYGYQITIAPFFSNNEDNSTTFLSFGVTALRKINEARIVNLFIYCGVHDFYYKDIYKRSPTIPDDGMYYSYEDSKVNHLILGAGPGLDFHFLRISFSLMCGIAGHYERFSREYGCTFTGETALYYSF